MCFIKHSRCVSFDVLFAGPAGNDVVLGIHISNYGIDNNAFIGHRESFLMHRSLIVGMYPPLEVARGTYFHRRDNYFALKYFLECACSCFGGIHRLFIGSRQN